MKTYIITEGLFDKQLISMVLAARSKLDELEVIAGGSRSSASSYARTLLATSSSRVALVLDADTVVPRLIDAQRAEYEASLSMVDRGGLSKVIFAIPELEACFFSDPALAERLFGKRLSKDQILTARYEPRKILSELIPKRDELLQRLSHEDLKVLLEQPPFPEILAFVDSTRGLPEPAHP